MSTGDRECLSFFQPSSERCYLFLATCWTNLWWAKMHGLFIFRFSAQTLHNWRASVLPLSAVLETSSAQDTINLENKVSMLVISNFHSRVPHTPDSSILELNLSFTTSESPPSSPVKTADDFKVGCMVKTDRPQRVELKCGCLKDISTPTARSYEYGFIWKCSYKYTDTVILAY